MDQKAIKQLKTLEDRVEKKLVEREDIYWDRSKKWQVY